MVRFQVDCGGLLELGVIEKRVARRLLFVFDVLKFVVSELCEENVGCCLWMLYEV